MAIRNPFKTINGQTYIDKSMTDKSPNSDDNMRVIWRAGGRAKAHPRKVEIPSSGAC